MLGEHCTSNCTINEAELFDPIDRQVILDKAQWVDIHPLNNVSTEGPIEFVINGSMDDCLDLNNTMLMLKAKVVNAAGNANLLAIDNIAPINNWMHTMWSDIQVAIGNKVIEGGNHHYPYKSYLMNLLGHNAGSKNTHLQASGWFKDTAGKMTDGSAENKGFTARKALIVESREVELGGPLLLDFFVQNKYLLQNTDISVKLIRSKPEFQMMIKTADNLQARATAVKLVIKSAILYVRRVKGIPSYILTNEDKLNYQNALYPIQRTEMITYTIATGSQSHSKESLFRGLMPKLLVIGLTTNAAYNGSYTTNPFNFNHFNVNQMALYREGESIPFRPLTPNFANKHYVREYLNLMHSLDNFNKPEDIDLSLDEFGNGYTLFSFNLTPNLTVGGLSQPIRDGNLRLEMQFSQALTNTINVIVMGVFDGCIEITKQRNVILDWKS